MVDVQMLALVCIIIGAILLTIEALSPGVFVIIPGTVLVILGIVTYFFPEMSLLWVVVLAIVIAAAVTIGTVKMYQLLGKPEPPTTTVMETLIGKSGKVKVKTNPDNFKGKVWIDNDMWSAKSEEPIEAGADVVVIESQGVHVKVKRA